MIYAYIFVLFIIAIAFWKGDRASYILGGFGLMIYAFSYATTNIYYSLLMGIAGLYVIMRGFIGGHR